MKIDLTQPFHDAKNNAENWTLDRIERICNAIARFIPDTESTFLDDYVNGGVSPRVEMPGPIFDTGLGFKAKAAIDWIAIVWNRGPLVVINPRYATDSIVEQIKRMGVIVLKENIEEAGYHMDKSLLNELFPDKLQDFDPDDITLADIFMYPL